jgi:hypothetical protein
LRKYSYSRAGEARSARRGRAPRCVSAVGQFPHSEFEPRTLNALRSAWYIAIHRGTMRAVPEADVSGVAAYVRYTRLAVCKRTPTTAVSRCPATPLAGPPSAARSASPPARAPSPERDLCARPRAERTWRAAWALRPRRHAMARRRGPGPRDPVTLPPILAQTLCSARRKRVSRGDPRWRMGYARSLCPPLTLPRSGARHEQVKS